MNKKGLGHYCSWMIQAFVARRMPENNTWRQNRACVGKNRMVTIEGLIFDTEYGEDLIEEHLNLPVSSCLVLSVVFWDSFLPL